MPGGLDLTNAKTGRRVTVPVDYVTAGNVSVDYASTINRAQGATVDEAHLLLGDRTNTKQLYVGVTRGRTANHIHTAPPAFDLDQHGPATDATSATPRVPVDTTTQHRRTGTEDHRRSRGDRTSTSHRRRKPAPTLHHPTLPRTHPMATLASSRTI
jgi:hypothetical protein